MRTTDPSGHPQRYRVAPVLFQTLDAVPPVRLAALGAALAAAIALADYATGSEASFAVFYLMPVVLVSAGGTRALAEMVAGVAALGWVLADVLSRPTAYTSPAIPVWNGVSRLLVFLVVVWLVTSLRRSVAHERRLSRVDSLSGVANRRAFYEAVEMELQRARRTPTPLTVAFLDIDDFKRVNDELGHAEGDAVIRVTAQALTAHARVTDVVARLGGDEFGILLTNASRDVAGGALERLHSELLAQARQRGWSVGFSVGAVTWRQPPRSVDEMLATADKAMYHVKASGKNKVYCVDVGDGTYDDHRRLDGDDTFDWES